MFVQKKRIESTKLILKWHGICCMFELPSHGKQSFREEEGCTPGSLMLLWSRSASSAQGKTWKEPSQLLTQPLLYMVIVSENITASYFFWFFYLILAHVLYPVFQTKVDHSCVMWKTMIFTRIDWVKTAKPLDISWGTSQSNRTWKAPHSEEKAGLNQMLRSLHA